MKAILIIHGFADGVYETKYLIEYLNKYFDVFHFVLPKHDQPVIKDVKYEEWIKKAEDEFLKLKDYKKIIIIGHSMGGVIATYLASKYKVHKLILLAPAFKIGNFKQVKKDVFKTKKEEDIYNRIFKTLKRIPLKTFIEFLKLINKYKDAPKKVDCNTLILQGLQDEIVPLKSPQYVYDNLKSKKKHLKLIDNVRHKILISEKKEKIFKYIKYYINGGLIWIIMKKSKI